MTEQAGNPSRQAGNRAGRLGQTTWRSYVAEVPAWAIVGGAMAVSFWTQVMAVGAHSFASWEALVWGTSTDFGTLACLFLAREGAHRGTPTWGAWLLSLACAGMSVQFNVVRDLQVGDWLGVEAHVWMPALALGVWYWMLHGRHRRWEWAAWMGSYARGGQVAADTPIVGIDGRIPSGAGSRPSSGSAPRSPAAPSVSPALLIELAAEQGIEPGKVLPRDLAARLDRQNTSYFRDQVKRAKELLAAQEAGRAPMVKVLS